MHTYTHNPYTYTYTHTDRKDQGGAWRAKMEKANRKPGKKKGERGEEGGERKEPAIN